MKILFVISVLDKKAKGGLEKVGIQLASGLAKRGHDIAIITYAYAPPIDNLDAGVQVICVSSPRNHDDIENLRNHLLALAPDICVPMFSWKALLFWPLAVQGTGIHLCISEHSDPWKIEEERWNREERLACMQLADSIHLLQDGFLESLPVELHRKAHIVPNPVDVDAFAKAVKSDGMWRQHREKAGVNRSNAHSVIITGRLVDSVKQIALVIEAFSLLPPDCDDWILEIYGDGPDRGRLEQYIASLRLQNRIFLRGYSEDMPTAYACSQICAISSKFEGFCLSMVEAMATGLPVVAFEGCSGIRHSAIHEKTAILAPEMNARSFAGALSRLMRDSSLRKKLGEQAQQHVQAFSLNKIIDKWEAMLWDCLSKTLAWSNNGNRQEAINLLYTAVDTIPISHARTIHDILRERIKNKLL
jgi:glycosyltransferase involved in cell wall biosynthesis